MLSRRCTKDHELVTVLPYLAPCECGPYDKPYLKGLAEELDRADHSAGGWAAIRDRVEAEKAKQKEKRAAQHNRWPDDQLPDVRRANQSLQQPLLPHQPESGHAGTVSALRCHYRFSTVEVIASGLADIAKKSLAKSMLKDEVR
jgi:hypothetical protein